jgi:hypothetical protein
MNQTPTIEFILPKGFLACPFFTNPLFQICFPENIVISLSLIVVLLLAMNMPYFFLFVKAIEIQPAILILAAKVHEDTQRRKV